MGLFSRRKTSSESPAPPTDKPTEPFAQDGSNESVRAPSDASTSGRTSEASSSRSEHARDIGHGPAPAPALSHTGTSKTPRKGKSSGGLFRLGSKSSANSPGNHHGGPPVEVDPEILSARERIESAEAAEVEADRALEQARLRVREAREYAGRIEEEAREEARRAQIKAFHASEVTKRGGRLGRHGE